MAQNDFAKRKCRPCNGNEQPMANEGIEKNLKNLEGWKHFDGQITKTFEFDDYYETTAFVDAVTWLAHHENHHPYTCFDYKKCDVFLKTHAIGGISENDFIFAAKIDKLLAL